MRKNTIIIFGLFFIILFSFYKAKFHKFKLQVDISKYQYVCILPPYANQFTSPYMVQDLGINVVEKLNTFLKLTNQKRNAEDRVSLIFASNNYTNFAIENNISFSQFESILGVEYDYKYNSTCINLK